MNKLANLSQKSVHWLVVIFVCLFLAACAQFSFGPKTKPPAPAPVQHPIPPVTSSNSGPSGLSASTPPAPTVTYQFPDLPIPTQLVKIDSDSMIVSTPRYQGGIIVLRGRVTTDSVVNFFSKELPLNGWHLSGTIMGRKDFLAFTKTDGSACLIQVYNISMGFETEVQIWVSEPKH